MKKIIVVPTFLISGLAFAQTTVTLEGQCNCMVLGSPDVATTGMTTPARAGTGGIYVSTNTGTIYFWDVDYRKPTSSNDQQLQDFTFDSVANTISPIVENRNTVTVDLSSLDQTEIDVSCDNTTSLPTATNVQDTIDGLNAATGAVSLIDNGYATYT